MITAKDVSGYFISLVDSDNGDFLTNLKIQKLLYYAQGFSLALIRAPLFDEPIIAWNLGPVVVEVYEEYKQFGSDGVPLPDNFDVDKFDDDTKELLDEVYEVYGQFSPSALVEMTHSEPPWRYTKVNNEISHRAMQDYFTTQLKQNAQ